MSHYKDPYEPTNIPMESKMIDRWWNLVGFLKGDYHLLEVSAAPVLFEACPSKIEWDRIPTDP